MAKRTVDVVAGARPNFIKIAALFQASRKFPRLRLRFIHTGQHYAPELSDIFLKQLGLPSPAHHLRVGSASHGVQTAEIIRRYEEWSVSHRPDICLVVGDVNSTIGCALASVKQNIPVAHVEAGLRSFDRSMPEEINRILTDSISRWHFVTEPSGVINLKKEGHPPASIRLVGNVMIDTLFRMRPAAQKLRAYQKYGLSAGRYAYLTLHRPSNVDKISTLSTILDQLVWLSTKVPVVFPVHPRTMKNLETPALRHLLKGAPQLRLIKPLGYMESLSLMMSAAMVITDSGGMQEETSFLNVPCLTLRENTERPITLTRGTNTLIKNNWTLFRRRVKEILAGQGRAEPRKKIPLWDGRAAQRILKVLDQSA